MLKVILVVLTFCCSQMIYSQVPVTDTLVNGNVTVIKDPRIEILGNKMAEYYESLSHKTRMGQGYRLLVLNTNDRILAMNVRTQLLQLYPEHKLYTIFKSPFIRLKFGNFEDQEEAEKMKNQLLAAGIITGNIYVVPERIEIKPDKVGEIEEE